jgi:hypothetical protein
MSRRPPIKTRAAQLYLPCPSAPHPTEAPTSVVLECLLRNRPGRGQRRAILKRPRCRHVALKDNMRGYRAVVFWRRAELSAVF